MPVTLRELDRDRRRGGRIRVAGGKADKGRAARIIGVDDHVVGIAVGQAADRSSVRVVDDGLARGENVLRQIDRQTRRVHLRGAERLEDFGENVVGCRSRGKAE